MPGGSGEWGHLMSDVHDRAVPDGERVWPVDPVDLALDGSTARRSTPGDWLPQPFCLDAGRRILLAQLQFSDWVLRRVEKVQFERERSVTREISIDFAVRPDAPVFVTRGDASKEMYLVPLTMMRRRTLVNLALNDEDKNRIPMLGLRFTQQLDEAVMLAAAEATAPGLGRSEQVIEFVQEAVAGTAKQVDDALKLFREEVCAPPHICQLRGRTMFAAMLDRLEQSFTFYVLLDKTKGTHRVLTLSFEEPTDWTLQRAALDDIPGGVRYRPLQKVARGKRLRILGLAQLGLTPTRMRFQVPAAENTASYHFEAAAPLGVRIVRASLVAGRPNEPSRHISIDHVVGHAPNVGLHAVEIPNGSLCRVQLDLRVPSGGWLTTLVMSCVFIMFVLGFVAWFWGLKTEPLGQLTSPEASSNNNNYQFTNVILLLVTASASAATLVAQREFHGLAAAMVTHLRAVGVLSLSLPIVAAAILVYAGLAPSESAQRLLKVSLPLIFALSVALVVLTATAWSLSFRAERNTVAEASPWDMTVKSGEGNRVSRRSDVPDNFSEAIRALGFDSPAIGIQSAESWHRAYTWNDGRQKKAVEALSGHSGPGSPEAPALGDRHRLWTCASSSPCPVHDPGFRSNGAVVKGR